MCVACVWVWAWGVGVGGGQDRYNVNAKNDALVRNGLTSGLTPPPKNGIGMVACTVVEIGRMRRMEWHSEKNQS